MRRSNAFSLTELVIAMLIIGIMAAAMTLSTGAAKHTARMEAERVASMIGRLIEAADRNHSSFWFMIKSDGFYTFWGRKYENGKEEKFDFKIGSGCSCSAVDSYNNMGYMVDTKYAPSGKYREISKRNVSFSVETEARTGSRIFCILVAGEGTPAYVVISQNEL